MKNQVSTKKVAPLNKHLFLLLVVCNCALLVRSQTHLGTWTLLSATYNNNKINNASGYLKLINDKDYTASFTDGTNKGYANAHYTLEGKTFKTTIDGVNLILNGVSSRYTFPGYTIIYQTSISSSSTAFTNYVGPAIGYGQPTITINGDSLILSSKSGKAKMNYIKGDYMLYSDFIASENFGVAPFTVQFSDKSTGNITERVWDFGDGNTSNETNPSHTFQNPGKYSVSLKISNKYLSNSKIKTNEINVLGVDELKAQYIYSSDESNSLKIKFDDKSLGNSTNWKWDFGDGEISSEQNPHHLYFYPGEYKVRLTVSNSINKDSVLQTINIGEKWKFYSSKYFYSSPTIGKDGTIYIGSTDSCLYALSPDGKITWKYKTGGSINSSPTVGLNGIVFIGSNDNYLYAINPNGSFEWKFKTGGAIYSSPAIASDGTIYVGSYDDYMWAINSNGTEKWKFKTGGDIYSSPSINTDGIVYFGSKDDNFYAINPDGTEKWKYKTGGDINSSPAISKSGYVYVGSNDDYLYAFNLDGTIKWRYKTGGDIVSSPSTSKDGNIYIGSKDDYFYSFKQDGTLNWKYKTGGDIESSPAITDDETIYIGSNDDYLYSFDSKGLINWKYKTQGDLRSSPVINSDGYVFIGSLDNHFYAFNGKNGKLSDSDWPCFRGNAQHTGILDITVNNKTIENVQELIKLYPNPTKGLLNVEGLPVGKVVNVSIYNISGHLVKQFQINESAYTIDLSKEIPGIYFINLYGKENQIIKIIKE